MRSRGGIRSRLLLVVGSVLALAVPMQARGIVIINNFEGVGITGDPAYPYVLAAWSAASTEAAAGGEGVMIIDDNKRFLINCARFEPEMRTGLGLGGTLFVNGMAPDGTWYAVKLVDKGPGGGMDEVGIVVIGGMPDPGAPACGAAGLGTQPFMAGEFVSGSASL